MDNIELIVINKWKKWGKNDFVYLWITSLVRLVDKTGGESKMCHLFFYSLGGLIPGSNKFFIINPFYLVNNLISLIFILNLSHKSCLPVLTLINVEAGY